MKAPTTSTNHRPAPTPWEDYWRDAFPCDTRSALPSGGAVTPFADFSFPVCGPAPTLATRA